jgi:hypothetical protein
MCVRSSLRAARVSSALVRSWCFYAVEEGWPVVGMAPELLKRQFGMDYLFRKHGGPFVMNTGGFAGRAVCLRDLDAILEVSLKADVLTVHLPGAVFMKHPCCLHSKRLPTPNALDC